MREDPAAPLNYTYIATQTEGYSATDLQDLVARAVHQSAIKVAMEEKPVSGRFHAGCQVNNDCRLFLRN